MSDEKENRIPAPGDRVNMGDLEEIVEAIVQRGKNFPDEPGAMTIGLVLMNIGDRFTPVVCRHGEWMGIKKDLQKGDGVPTCPNGHVLTEGKGLKLGWIEGD